MKKPARTRRVADPNDDIPLPADLAAALKEFPKIVRRKTMVAKRHKKLHKTWAPIIRMLDKIRKDRDNAK